MKIIFKKSNIKQMQLIIIKLVDNIKIKRDKSKKCFLFIDEYIDLLFDEEDNVIFISDIYHEMYIFNVLI